MVAPTKREIYEHCDIPDISEQEELESAQLYIEHLETKVENLEDDLAVARFFAGGWKRATKERAK
jgi:hypothetical protein